MQKVQAGFELCQFFCLLLLLVEIMKRPNTMSGILLETEDKRSMGDEEEERGISMCSLNCHLQSCDLSHQRCLWCKCRHFLVHAALGRGN